MAGGKEKFEKIGKLLLANINKLMIAGQVLLLLAVGVMWFGESNSPASLPPEPTPVEVKAVINRDSDNYKKAVYVVTKLEPFDATYYRELGEYNMFDPKAAKDSESLAKEADRKFLTAQQLYQEGKLKEALDALNGILATYKLKPAIELKDKIAKELNPPAATPAPGAPAAPGAAPAPGAPR